MFTLGLSDNCIHQLAYILKLTKKMSRKLKNYSWITNTLKFLLFTSVFIVVITIFIYKENIFEGNLENESFINANQILSNGQEKGTTGRRSKINESVTEDSIPAINKIDNRRIVFPPQPKYLIEYANDEESIKAEVSKNGTEEEKFKKILIWNSVGTVFEIGFGRTPFLIGECQFNNCFVTAQKDRYNASEVDALIWHVRGTDISLPKIRYPNAKYCFLNWEPVRFLFSNMQDYKDIFDFTITYREDSDIPFPYNEIATRDKANESYFTGDYSIGKTKMAAWFVSNCDGVSGRSILVKQMQKYLDVDVYGQCGNLSCGTPHAPYDCFEKVEREYFYYLSFENSICKDYITEKFFNALRYEVVPVVYGYGPYWKHAPPNSYIDVLDFTSIKELAQYLVHLSKTPKEYNEYFRWKANYFVLPKYSGKIHTICKLCEMLNTPQFSRNSRYDLQDWFVNQSRCKEMDDPIISSFLGGKKLKHSYNEIRCFIDSENC